MSAAVAEMPVVAAPAIVAKAPLTRGPMVGLPPISKHNTVAESQAQRQSWTPPTIIPGEVVFYRPSGNGHSNEFPAIITRQSNKTWSMLVSKPNYVFEEKSSVEYWDHTEADPRLTGDPHAPHNNNGTFRRTEFSLMLSGFVDKIGTLPDVSGDVGSLKGDVVTLKAEIDKIKAELRKMASK